MNKTTTKNEFSDMTGKIWPIRINLVNLRDVKESHGIDLAQIATDPRVFAAFGDMVTTAEILGTLLARELEDNGMTREAFETNLDGEAIESAQFAIVRAIRDFLPEAPKKLVAGLYDTMVKAEEHRNKVTREFIDSGKFNKLVDAAMQETHDKVDALLADSNND